MRRGERCRPWTASEERRLAEIAGTMPRREVARALRRSNEAVRQKASRMGVSLRHWEPRCSETCPVCGMARTGLRASGTCRPCELRALVARAESETAEAMERLGPADRAVYASTETRLQSAPDPRPAPPRTEGMTPYRAARARDAYQEALERWEVRTLTRLLNARRRRLERMIKKISNQ